MQPVHCSRDADSGLARADHLGSCQAGLFLRNPGSDRCPPTVMEGPLGGYFGAVATQGWTTNGMNL